MKSREDVCIDAWAMKMPLNLEELSPRPLFRQWAKRRVGYNGVNYEQASTQLATFAHY